MSLIPSQFEKSGRREEGGTKEEGKSYIRTQSYWSSILLSCTTVYVS